MMRKDDHELIRDYVQGQSQAAFAELVDRHVNLVFSAARRQVRSHHLAEEVTQAVFVQLARNAHKLKPETPLAAWLHLVTRRTTVDLMRRELRRQAREQTAVEIAAMKTPAHAWHQIESSLDEALTSLDKPDHAALLLRFFENKSLREVGHALGVSEDAAQKRVSRALEQLRGQFARQGIAVSADGLAADLSAHAIEVAPAALGPTIVLAGATAGLAHAVIPAATFAMTTLHKAVIAAGLMLAAGGALFEANVVRIQSVELDRLRQQNERLATQVRLLGKQQAAALQHLDETQQRLAALRADGAAASTADTAAVAEMKAWLGRVRLLKEFIAQNPEKGIPEMRLLSENDWLRAVQNTDPDETRGREVAMKGLRSLGKVRFGLGMADALLAYVKAHDGQLPAQSNDLLPFFTDNAYFKASQVAADMLQRYSVVCSGLLADVTEDERNATIVETASPDEDHDQRVFIGPNGFHIGTFQELDYNTRHALNAFAKTNPGATPANPAQLLPYFNPPLSAAQQSRFLLNASSLLPH